MQLDQLLLALVRTRMEKPSVSEHISAKYVK